MKLVVRSAAQLEITGSGRTSHLPIGSMMVSNWGLTNRVGYLRSARGYAGG